MKSVTREINRDSPMELGSDFPCGSLLLIAVPTVPNEKRQARPSSARG